MFMRLHLVKLRFPEQYPTAICYQNLSSEPSIFNQVYPYALNGSLPNSRKQSLRSSTADIEDKRPGCHGGQGWG